MKSLHIVTFILLIIGGINWLLVGIIGWDIGELFGGQGNIISRILYIIIGVGAVLEVIAHKGACKNCGGEKKGGETPAAPVNPAQ